MKIVFTQFILLLSLSAISQPKYILFLNDDLSTSKYTFVWGDEFSQMPSSVNWRFNYPWGKVNIINNEKQIYLPDNVTIENGYLKLQARKESKNALAFKGFNDSVQVFNAIESLPVNDTNIALLRTFDYTSGLVYSKPEFKYGLFEARFKVPEGKGFWPAFWLFGHKGEIDVFEILGHQTDKTHHDLHLGTKLIEKSNQFDEKTGGWIKLSHKLSDDFNSMNVIWKENTIHWYLNNIPLALEYHIFDYPMSVIFNLAIPNDCPSPFCPGPDEKTTFPANFWVDYVRAYKPDDSSTIILILNLETITASLDEKTDIQGIARAKNPKKFLKKIDNQYMNEIKNQVFRLEFDENKGVLTVISLKSKPMSYSLSVYDKNKNILVSEMVKENIKRVSFSSFTVNQIFIEIKTETEQFNIPLLLFRD